MPKRKENSSHRGETLLQYSPLQLQRAIWTYQEETASSSSSRKRRGYKQIAKIFSVPPETLRRKVKKYAAAGPVTLPPSHAPPTGHHQPVSMYPSMPTAVYPAQIPPSMQAGPHMPFVQPGPASVQIGFGGITVGFQPPPTAPSQYGYQMYPSFAQPGPAPWQIPQQQMPPAQPGPAPWQIPQQPVQHAQQILHQQSTLDEDDSDSDDSSVNDTNTTESDTEEEDAEPVSRKFYKKDPNKISHRTRKQKERDDKGALTEKILPDKVSTSKSSMNQEQQNIGSETPSIPSDLTAQDTTSKLGTSNELHMKPNDKTLQLPAQVSPSEPVDTTSEPHVQTLEIDKSAELTVRDTTSELELSKEQQSNNISQLPAQVSASSGPVDTTSEPDLETIEIIAESPSNNQADWDSLATKGIENSTKNSKKQLHVKPNNHISEFYAPADVIEIIPDVNQADSDSFADLQTVRSVPANQPTKAMDFPSILEELMRKHKVGDNQTGYTTARPIKIKPLSRNNKREVQHKPRMTLKTLEKNMMGTTKSVRAKPDARTSRAEDVLINDVCNRALFAVVENMKKLKRTDTVQHRKDILKFGSHPELVDLT